MIMASQRGEVHLHKQRRVMRTMYTDGLAVIGLVPAQCSDLLMWGERWQAPGLRYTRSWRKPVFSRLPTACEFIKRSRDWSQTCRRLRGRAVLSWADCVGASDNLWSGKVRAPATCSDKMGQTVHLRLFEDDTREMCLNVGLQLKTC